MIDGFVFFTPILLLGVIALFGFVGCDVVFGLHHIDPSPALTHAQTVVATQAATKDVITAAPLTLQGGELIVVTLQWRSGVIPPVQPTLTGANFANVPGGGPFNWNGMNVQSFFAFNPKANTSLTVAASLTGGSSIQWFLCVSAYANPDLQNPVYSPQQNGSAFSGTNPQTPPIAVNSGDLVYAVIFAANNNGSFPGTVTIAAGSGFTAESGSTVNPLIEDGNTTSPVTASATISGDANPRAFIFAMGIKAADS